MKNQITLQDISFDLYIKETDILHSIQKLAQNIENHYKEMPLLLGVLNGAFVFASDLCRFFERDHEIEFVKYQSYRGMQGGGVLSDLIGIKEDKIRERTILIVEDIVDTGNTLAQLTEELYRKGAKKVDCVTAFFKPEAFKRDNPPLFVAIECENRFLVGYGMDYNGLGRNLRDLYVLSSMEQDSNKFQSEEKKH